MLQPTTPFVEQISANGNRGTFPLSQLKGSPHWRTFERGYPLPPGFDPIRPQMTRLDPMLKASAEGRKPKKPRGA